MAGEPYDLVGVVQTVSLGETRYLWDDAIARGLPRTRHVVHVDRRKPPR